MVPNQPSPGPRSDRRALLVDDDKFMLEVVGDLLREQGVSAVTTAANGAATIEALECSATKPDVVPCDLNMPVNDGLQPMEQLGARGCAGGVDLFSGMDDQKLHSASLMARFHRLKFLGTLKKPVDKAAFSTALAHLV